MHGVNDTGYNSRLLRIGPAEQGTDDDFQPVKPGNKERTVVAMQKLLSRQLAVVILLCGLRFAQSFFILSTKRIPLLSAPQVRFQRRVNLVAQCVASQNDDCNLHVAHDLKNKIVLPQDTTATLRNLVQLGDEWSRSSDTASIASSNSNTLRQSQFEKVSGCSSLVEIKTSLYASDSDSSDHPQHILVEGKADSRVTQGMLAVLCQVQAFHLTCYIL